MKRTTRRLRERGSAMLVTLVVITALLAGAAVLLSLQLSAMRSSDLTRNGTSAMYCAEAGLAVARGVVAQQLTNWAGSFCTASPILLCTAPGVPVGCNCSEPAWLATGIGSHDLDSDGDADFVVYLVDNDDEIPPVVLDNATDNDLQVFIVSRCIAFPETEKQVEELVQHNGAAPCNPLQQGGGGGDGNNNGC